MFKKQIRSVLTLVLIVVLMLPFFPMKAHAAHENTYKNTGNMRNDIIGVALTQVGYNEGSNNYTKYGVWYGQSNSPWCGMFVSWCAKEAGIPTSVLKRTGIANPKNFGLSYKDGQNYTPQKGDLFFKKSFSHVGLVYYTEGAYFYTIEGNTSTTSYEGTSVMIRKRKISDFYFSSPNYSGSSNSGCSHDYTTKVESDHPHKEYKVCSKCNNKTYTGSKKTVDTCKTCIQENCSHTYSNWTSSGDDKHNKICSKCEKKVTESHNWKSGDVIKEPTCVDSGSRKITCSVCNAESSKKIDPTGEHKYGNFSYIDESKHQKVCSTCGDQTTAQHTVNTNWDHDSLYHWTSCTDCGGSIKRNEHDFSDGCLNPCDDCGYSLESGHRTSDEYVSDASQHWNICSRCGMNANTQNHYYTSDCDEFCNGCNYHREIKVSHQDTYKSDETGHWSVCTSCARITEITSHSPNESALDWEAQLCTECGYELRSADKHVHTFQTVAHDSQNHWGTCVCGQVMDREVHSWNIQTGTCTVCNCPYVDPADSKPTNFLVSIWRELFKSQR